MKETIVQYYDAGWHIGHLIRRGRKWTRIRRILPAGMKPARRGQYAAFITVPTSDVREVER